MNRSLLRCIALGLALVLPSGAVAMAQAPTWAQVQLGVAGNVSGPGKIDKKGGIAANNRANDGKDNAELLEEMRQMRQLIERLEARINRLEAEKSASMVKQASATGEAVVPASKDTSPAIIDSSQTTPEALAGASIQAQTTTPSQAQKAALSTDDRDARFLARYYGQRDRRRLLRLQLQSPARRHQPITRL